MEPSSLAQLSVVIPAYNESATILAAVQAVLRQECVLEIIVVDDGSTDDTLAIASNIARAEPRVHLLQHNKNQGKGAAVRTGLKSATGEYVIIQDADLEYDPADYSTILKPFLDGKADVVFGTRFSGGGAHRVLYYWHYLGNRLLTLLSNMATNLNLTDMECCYKAMRRSIVDRLNLKEERFGIEPEITAKIARQGVRIYEVSVSYYGRTYAEGKKIRWKDGVRAIWCIFKYGVLRL
jgi:glycosyltransferase involved in cell wall biosynthesis